VLPHHLAHAPHARPPFRAFHLQRLADGVGQLLGVVGVDDESVGQLARRPGEGAQDKHTIVVIS